MYLTKEIRWFFKNENEHINRWFDRLEFDNFEQREDFYLDLGKEDLGVKLRQGNIEIKYSVGTRSKGCLNKNAWGYFEKWNKWSFSVENKEAILSGMTIDDQSKWTSVLKERKIAILTFEQGEENLLAADNETASSCQFEYSRIQVSDSVWYTFGLEYSGDLSLKIRDSLITEILGDTKFAMNQSMGYPAFLAKCQQLRKEDMVAQH
ncbi:MAG: hypothetical protein HKN31_12880 [Pricia sp.]|nr:hypothetical protein [Pricia sp.]